MKFLSNYFNATTLFLSVCMIALSCMPSGQDSSAMESMDPTNTQPGTEVTYDSVKAKLYGADDYGMKKYVMAFLKRGPNTEIDSAESAKLMRGHLDNINRMAEEGTLVLAGPFFGNGDLRGIYIFDVDNLADAEALTNTDPAIQAGRLEMELLEWYGSAALLDLKDRHAALAKKKI